jgi:riboflavin transporter FmnP
MLPGPMEKAVVPVLTLLFILTFLFALILLFVMSAAAFLRLGFWMGTRQNLGLRMRLPGST